MPKSLPCQFPVSASICQSQPPIVIASAEAPVRPLMVVLMPSPVVAPGNSAVDSQTKSPALSGERDCVQIQGTVPLQENAEHSASVVIGAD